jgi:predicted anti-sigma-YlaC factor YlaD
MDHAQAQETFSEYLDGTLAARVRADVDQHLGACIQCRTELESLRRTVGSLGRLRQAAPAALLPEIKQQIYRRSRGRFFAPRWKLFGRIPFEWVSLATIIAMLVYYLAMLHGSPSGVHSAP